MCTDTTHEQLFTRASDATTMIQPSASGSSLGRKAAMPTSGARVYTALVRYLRNYLRQLLDIVLAMSGSAPLVYYAQEWDRYCQAAVVIDHIFSYMNRCESLICRDTLPGADAVKVKKEWTFQESIPLKLNHAFNM